jgi:hypothetical protein
MSRPEPRAKIENGGPESQSRPKRGSLGPNQRSDSQIVIAGGISWKIALPPTFYESPPRRPRDGEETSQKAMKWG